MADDLSDVYAELRALKEQVRVLMTANPLENSSVRNGRIRLIGGTLRVDAGGRVEIDGTFVGAGGMTWTGTVTLESTFTQNGPWNLNGAGNIAGDVNQTGNTTQQGNVNVTGGGKITAGNVTVEPNKITVGGIDGNSILSDSKLTFANGAELRAPGSGGVRLTYGTTNIFCDGTSAIVTSGTRRVIVTNAGFQFFGVPSKTPAATGLTTGAAHLDVSGNLFRVS